MRRSLKNFKKNLIKLRDKEIISSILRRNAILDKRLSESLAKLRLEINKLREFGTLK